MAKKIGIMTTGGDCSGLNSVIRNLTLGAEIRGWNVVGILDGTDGLTADKVQFIKMDSETVPVESVRFSGSFLKNGYRGAENFQTAAKRGNLNSFNKKLKKSLGDLKLDALVLIGGNGSLSLAHANRDIYSGLQLVCIPKTIDKDVPKTDNCVGFSTAVQCLTGFCDQLLMTARSHHRWFVVQTMGRDTGHLALHAGLAAGADAILIPEIKWNFKDLVNKLISVNRDYGIIMVAEGVSVRGHSGRAADIITRELNKAGFICRSSFPDHLQRTGDSVACDRILAARFAEAALSSIENGETYVTTSLQDGVVKTVELGEFFDGGVLVPDPNIPNMQTSNSYVGPEDPVLMAAHNLGIYLG